jgi:hypothetical protein
VDRPSLPEGPNTVTVIFRIRASLELGQAPTMPTGSENGPQAPVCETCGWEMTLLTLLTRIGNRPCVRVYKCLPCGRIEAVYET